MKNFLASLSYALLLAVSLQEAHAVNKPEIINIGVAAAGIGGRPNVGGWLPGTVHSKKFIENELKDEGIEVRWHFFQTAGPGVNEALTNELLDFAFQGDLPQIVGYSNGLKLKYILPIGRRGTNYVAVTEDSGIQRIEDLPGKRFSIFKGTCTQLVANRLLEAHGIKEQDLQVYNMNSPASIAALASKDIDGAISGSDLFAIRDRGLAKIIYNSQEEGNKYGCSLGFQVVEKFAQQYPEITQKVVTALVKAAHYSSEESNRNDLIHAWQQSGTPARHYKQDWEKLDLKRQFNVLFDDYIIKGYQRAIDDSTRFGLITKPVDINQWFDSHYLETALKELNLENYWTPEDANGQPGGKTASIH